jgi:serine/threonine protein phosphatase PrpC
MAGSTAVAIYITEQNIYTASLGDSRGIVSTVSEEATPIPALNQFYFKEVSVKRYLEAEALTKRKSGI